MSDIGAEVQVVPKQELTKRTVVAPEQPVAKETRSPNSWTEIRNNYQNSRYSETYQALAQQFKVWEASPIVGTDPVEWDRSCNQQMDKSRFLLQKSNPLATISEDKDVDKIAAIGKEFPLFGKKGATRLYIGLDPRRATDAFQALLLQLEANGSLKDIQAALNLDTLRGKKLASNMVIIYEPLSRPEVLDKVLQAYQEAKQKRPDLFSLSDRQKAFVMRDNLRSFHGLVDENMSFVEMNAYRKGGAFDSQDRGDLFIAFGINAALPIPDEQWITRTRTSEKEVGYKFRYEDQLRQRQGLVKPGDTLYYERKLSVPALVQYGTIIAK